MVAEQRRPRKDPPSTIADQERPGPSITCKRHPMAIGGYVIGLTGGGALRPRIALTQNGRRWTSSRGPDQAQHHAAETARKWIIAASVILCTILEVIDSSIVNVALPHMQGSFSATIDEVTWVITTYLVAAGIMIPTTGWIADSSDASAISSSRLQPSWFPPRCAARRRRSIRWSHSGSFRASRAQRCSRSRRRS